MTLYDRVMTLMGWDEPTTTLWFVTKNPLLGDVSPEEMILGGRIDRLKKFVSEAETASAQTRQRRKETK